MAAIFRDNPSYHGYISLQVLGHLQQEDTGARAEPGLLQLPQILHPCATPPSSPLPCTTHPSPFPSQQVQSQEGWEPQICCCPPDGDEGFRGKETDRKSVV